MRDSKWQLLSYIVGAVDTVIMFICYITANRIKFGDFRIIAEHPWERYMTLFGIIFIAYLVVSFVFEDEHGFIDRGVFGEAVSVIKKEIYIGALTVAYLYFTKTSEEYSRVHLVIFAGMATVFITLGRVILRRILVKSYHRSNSNEKIMLVTTSDRAETVVRRIKQTRNWYFRISSIAIIDKDMVGEIIEDIDVVANKENFVETIESAEVDSVFIHVQDKKEMLEENLIDQLCRMGKRVHVNIEEYDMSSQMRETVSLGKIPVVTYYGVFHRMRYRLAKRLFDMLIGTIGVLLFFIVYIIVGLAYLIERDPGHIVIMSPRVGKNGRQFYIHSFRTQYLKRKTGQSAIGKFLNKTKLTGLPMSINILSGSMSVVGPLALDVGEFMNLPRKARRGYCIKPGVLSYGRINFKHPIKDNFDEIVELEKDYVDDWTIAIDVRVIGKALTLPIFGNKKEKELRRTRKQLENIRLVKLETETLNEIIQDERPLEVENKDAYKIYKPNVLYSFVKRTFDIVCSLAGLIVLSPIFIILAILVKWEDGGSVFYGHLRVGHRGKKIRVYKFRSMSTNVGNLEKLLTPEQLQQYRTEFKIDNDPRITKVGNILRKTSLDELPQLINILKGDISIVGPRPIVEKETEIYGKEISKLLSVKPGLTGYWQAYARNNATYESGERQKMEMYYVENKSLWLDFKILCKTFTSVLKREGAQ